MFPRLLVLLVFCVSGNALAESSAARVVSLNGVAKVLGKVLNSGDTVPTGAVVQTGDATTLKLLLADDTIVDLGPNARFQVEKMNLKRGADREVTLQLDLGKARTSIQKKLNKKGKFLIRTKASVLAVRGTEILLDVGQSRGPGTEVHTVVSGRVDLSFVGGSARSIILGQGQQIRFDSVAGIGGGLQASPVTIQNPRRFVQPVRGLASMVQQFRGADSVHLSQVELGDRSGDSTLRRAVARVGPPSLSGGILPGDAILDLVPDPSGASASGGLNQVPGGLPGQGSGGSTAPVGAGRNVTLTITFDPTPP